MLTINVLTDSPVGLGQRLLATIVDAIITFLFAILLHWILGTSIIVVATIFSYAYLIFLPFLWNGYTLGKYMMGIRISPLSNEKLTLSTMLIREVLGGALYNFSFGILTLVSAYLISSRSDRRSIHDLLASTYVTSNPPEYNR